MLTSLPTISCSTKETDQLRQSGLNNGSRVRIALLFERIAFYGLLVTIFLAAIPYGTVDPWLVYLLVSIVCLFGVIRVLEGLLSGNFALSDPQLLLPVVAILFVGVIQILPLWNANNSLDLWSFSGNTISLDPVETRNFILRFTGYVICGDVLLRYTTTKTRLLALVVTVVSIGAGSAIFGFARLIFFDELGRLGLGDGFAQFINRNHFAFLMEMTLGLLVGVQLKFRLPNIYRPVIWLMTGIMLVAVIMSQSRGGIFSVLGIGIFAIFLIVNSRSPAIATSDSKEVRSISTSGFLRSNKILLTLTCIVVFLSISVFMIAFVGGDPVVTRIERLQNEIQERPENRFRRLDIWKATLELIKTRPVAGSGFGAYPVAITPFDQSSGRMILQQAHDEYLDLVANGGFVAFGMMMLFLVLVFRRASVQLNSKDPFRSAVCFGAILGIVGVLLHNTVDYGLRTTVNAFVFIVLIVACTARVTAPGRHGAVG